MDLLKVGIKWIAGTVILGIGTLFLIFGIIGISSTVGLLSFLIGIVLCGFGLYIMVRGTIVLFGFLNRIGEKAANEVVINKIDNEIPEQPSHTGKFCPDCGGNVSENKKFCTECGADLRSV